MIKRTDKAITDDIQDSVYILLHTNDSCTFQFMVDICKQNIPGIKQFTDLTIKSIIDDELNQMIRGKPIEICTEWKDGKFEVAYQLD